VQDIGQHFPDVLPSDSDPRREVATSALPYPSLFKPAIFLTPQCFLRPVATVRRCLSPFWCTTSRCRPNSYHRHVCCREMKGQQARTLRTCTLSRILWDDNSRACDAIGASTTCRRILTKLFCATVSSNHIRNSRHTGDEYISLAHYF